MKTTTLLQSRDAAGAAYAAAAAAYIAAFIELHAHDLAAAGRGHAAPGFPALQPPTPHGTYLREYLHGPVSERVNARIAELST